MRAQIIGAVIAMSLAFIFGFTLQGWRLGAAHAEQLAAEKDKYSQLALTVEHQNSGIELANYKLEVANESRTKAELLAVSVRSQLNIQTTKASQITLTNCSDMVEQLKGVRF